ncbi:hypothetical protein C9374_007947 [Naegleria lovaniensis]|uniref:Uncharacterized protein n=1 Tax=Naegleria lovaniensis TaxID=51637 RepID=A0AA88GJS2_NAELO|nr:uncharacterized protein C9374_007947 [Naegleria lovaniensis]KAG2378799.1 hypothetical protein C9374_007947 [Naegleria lovaniensis]
MRKTTTTTLSTTTSSNSSARPGGSKGISSPNMLGKSSGGVSGTASSQKRSPSTGKASSTTLNRTTTPSSTTQPPESKHVKRFTQERYDKHKTANPFTAKNKFKTTFGGVYEAGGIPCRIQHTAANMHLKWDQDPQDMFSYDPLIVTIADGLRETDHPYIVMVQKAIVDLCTAPGAKEKIEPLLRQIVSYIRLALQSKEEVVFDNALLAITQIVSCVGSSLAPHLAQILVQISKKIFDKKYAPKIQELLRHIDRCCDSDEVVRLIKSKVPTYISVR